MIKIADRRVNDVEPHERLTVTDSEVYQVGEALTMTDKATKCAVGEKPTHICVGPAAGGVVPAMPVMDTTRYCVDYTAKPAVGAKVQLSTDGMDVTATTEGAFLVTALDEAKKKAYGHFVAV